MAILERLRRAWDGVSGMAVVVGVLLALVVVVPVTYVYGLWLGRKEGKIREGAARDIERVREAEATGDAGFLTRDLTRRSKGKGS